MSWQLAELHSAEDGAAQRVDVRASPGQPPLAPRQDERGRGGQLLPVRPAAQLVPDRLRAAVRRPVRGPHGEGPQGPGAGPDAPGGEEVPLPAQAGRLSGRSGR